MTMEEKKNWLTRYRRSVERQEVLRCEVEERRARAEGLSMRWDGTPGSGPDGDRLARAVERLTEAKGRLGAEYRLGRKLADELEQVMAQQEDERVRMILELRYLDGATWEAVAAALHTDRRWVQRIFTRALVGMKLPEPRRRRRRGGQEKTGDAVAEAGQPARG